MLLLLLLLLEIRESHQHRGALRSGKRKEVERKRNKATGKKFVNGKNLRHLEKQNKTTITKKILNEKQKKKRRENEKAGLPSGIERRATYAPRHMLPLGYVRTWRVKDDNILFKPFLLEPPPASPV